MHYEYRQVSEREGPVVVKKSAGLEKRFTTQSQRAACKDQKQEI